MRRDTIKVVADSKQFLHCNLDFPDSWDGFYVTAIFNKQGNLSTIIDVKKNTPFIVPSISVAGEGTLNISFKAVKNETVITTNAIAVEILPSGSGDSLLPNPTLEVPDPYAQYVTLVESERQAMIEWAALQPKKYTEIIGDGINSEFEIEHNLNTQDFVMSIKENNYPYNPVFCGYEIQSTNKIKLVFTEIPILENYTVTVIG